MFFKVIIRNNTPLKILKRGFKRLSGLYTAIGELVVSFFDVTNITNIT